MTQSPTPQDSNPVGNASLWLGIASSALVFGIGLCALTGAGQRWIQMPSLGSFWDFWVRAYSSDF